jgi:hypothetical protein
LFAFLIAVLSRACALRAVCGLPSPLRKTRCVGVAFDRRDFRARNSLASPEGRSIDRMPAWVLRVSFAPPGRHGAVFLQQKGPQLAQARANHGPHKVPRQGTATTSNGEPISCGSGKTDMPRRAATFPGSRA